MKRSREDRNNDDRSTEGKMGETDMLLRDMDTKREREGGEGVEEGAERQRRQSDEVTL